MSEEKTITKARCLELAKNLSDALKLEKVKTKEAADARAARMTVASEASVEASGVIFETAEGVPYYIAGVKGGGVSFRKCLPAQIAKAQAEGVVFIKLPANTVTSAA